MTKRTFSSYRIPGSNRTTLSDELAKEIIKHIEIDRENRFQLFLLCAGIRKRYLDSSQAGAVGRYIPEFEEWYKKNKFENLIGQTSNFTRYASAGEVVAHAAKISDEYNDYVKKLPVAVGALYECSIILNGQKRGLGKNIFKTCLNLHVTRKNKSQPQRDWTKKQTPVIRPTATETEINKWRMDFESPPPPKPKPKQKNHSLKLAEVSVNGRLFGFNKKTGAKASGVDMPDVEEFLIKLRDLFDEVPDDFFRMTDDMERLLEGYTKRRDDADPASKILGNTKTHKKVAKKKAPKKKTAKRR
jgi:hypothetical protein